MIRRRIRQGRLKRVGLNGVHGLCGINKIDPFVNAPKKADSISQAKVN
jgi:hypothetical protein